MATLTNSVKLNLTNSSGFVKEYQACALNSILLILEHFKCGGKVSIDEIKAIFDYDKDGISNEKYRYNKLNTYLVEKQIPYRFYISKFDSLNDLYKHLNNKTPVPVFFWLKVLNFTKKQYKTAYQLDFGDVDQSENKHALVLVGYDAKGEKLLFLDPSYQLPWIPQAEQDLTKHYVSLDAKDFYECAKSIKTFVEVRFLKVEAKKYKKARVVKEKQETLK
jgi:hypothetical protein